MADDEDPFAMLSEGSGFTTHPLFEKCSECKEYLVWDVWTAASGTKCRAWRCPTKQRGHTTEFV